MISMIVDLNYIILLMGTITELFALVNAHDAETIKKLKEREGGSKNPYQVQNDEERHKKQLELIKKQGLPKEPIILFKSGSKYELVEGWHRTIQNFVAHPEGYVGPAWVGYL